MSLSETYKPQLTVERKVMSKYGNRNGNWFEAIVNKLGGEEGAEKFLRDELVVTSASTDPWQVMVAQYRKVWTYVLECNSKSQEVELHSPAWVTPGKVRPLLVCFKPDLSFGHMLYAGRGNSMREADYQDGKWVDCPD